MLYGKFADNLLDRFKVARNDADARPIIKDKINLAHNEIGNVTNVNWKHLERHGELVTVPNYTTGTVVVTLGSRTVTGSGTAWTSAMVGRYLKPQGSNYWYKINAFVSTTELTLLSAYQDTTATGQTYTIWKRFYYLPSEVRKLLEFGDWVQNGELTETSIQKLGAKTTDISTVGIPEEFILCEDDDYSSVYSTGTVSLTADSNVATGTSTAWLGNAEPGDLLESSSQKLRVKRVESDTRIVLLNYATADVAAGTAYTLKKEYNLAVQLWYNPDRAYLIPYVYIKRVYDMVNENYDKPELPPEFDLAILEGAEAFRLADQDDARWINKMATYSARITDLKATRFLSQPRTRQMSPRIRSRGGYL